MAGCFTAAVLTALSHHLAYLRLDGTEVLSSIQQQWVIRGGTILAFITKMLLAVAASIAYTQWLFLCLMTKSYTLGRLDSMFAILSNALEFFDLRLWLTHPILAMLAIVTWWVHDAN
jgi:hypothetical protein